MINIVKAPIKYSPSGNPIFFTAQSNDDDIVYFTIEVKHSASNAVISSSKAFVTPTSPLTASIDLSNILKNYTKTPITTDSSFFTSYDTGYLDYYVKVTEMLNSGNTIAPGAIAISSDHTVYNATFSDSEFQYYGYRNYYINNITTAKFLTSKPSINNINPWSKEYLYFLADGNSGVDKAVVKVYSSSGSTIYSDPISTGSAKLHRLNISPKDLKNTMSIDFNDVQYFEVWIEDDEDNILTEVKRYRCVNYDCRTELVNVIWLDSYGGVSSNSFINPQESKRVNRSVIKLNKYKDYSIASNGVINQTEQTYNITKISEYTLTTPILNDWEYIYLTDMLASEQVYVELANGTFVPVKLLTTSADVKRKRYSTTALRFELRYEAESNLNIVPDSYLSFSNGLSQIGFSVPTLLSVPSNYFETVIGDGSSLYFNVVHNLASTNIAVDLVLISNGQTVYGDVVRTNSNSISVEFGDIIDTDSIKVMISKLD
jgi:hypothetical protein